VSLGTGTLYSSKGHQAFHSTIPFLRRGLLSDLQTSPGSNGSRRHTLQQRHSATLYWHLIFTSQLSHSTISLNFNSTDTFSKGGGESLRLVEGSGGVNGDVGSGFLLSKGSKGSSPPSRRRRLERDEGDKPLVCSTSTAEERER